MRKNTEVFAEPGRVVRRYSPQESKALAEAWLSAFEGSGAPNTKSYMWHVFSFEAYTSVSLSEARAQYEQQVAPSYIVLSNDRRSAVEMDQRPTWTSVPDCYVFPPNLAWTMAFTHEDDWLGPYFAVNQQYERLNRENLDKIRKTQDIEASKKKGWM